MELKREIDEKLKDWLKTDKALAHGRLEKPILFPISSKGILIIQ